jgi:hypothetical protein
VYSISKARHKHILKPYLIISLLELSKNVRHTKMEDLSSSSVPGCTLVKRLVWEANVYWEVSYICINVNVLLGISKI